MHFQIFKFSNFQICLFAFLHFEAIAQPKKVIDVQQYIFSAEINDKNDSIKGMATIYFKLLQRTNNVSLDFISRKANGKGMTVVSVTENGNLLNYTHANDILVISLPASGNINEEKIIRIGYGGIPADGLIISKNKYNHRTFFTDHWPNRARNWLPCIDHPSDKAAIEFRITAPIHYEVISNGVMIEERNLDANRKFTHYKENTPLPMKVAAIGAADFAVHYEGDINNIPVYTWVYPEDSVKGFYDYGLATEVLPFFIRNIGPYPYKKLANVQSKTIFGGMENAGAIFYPENSITGKRSLEATMAHEIAHQWFGDMITEAEWSHVWLSEGFATYMSILHMENKYGLDTAMKLRMEDRMQAIAFSKQKHGPVVDSSITDYLELLNANSYQKGGWVLHMLRRQLGDSVFWKGIQTYYAQYAGKNVVTDQFRNVMEEVSGKDLKQFFRQWLFTAGHPQLDIEWKYDKLSNALTLNITQRQTIPFEFSIDIAIKAGEKNVKSLAFVKDKFTTITISLPGDPLKIQIDPEVNLLYEGTLKQLH